MNFAINALTRSLNVFHLAGSACNNCDIDSKANMPAVRTDTPFILSLWIVIVSLELKWHLRGSNGCLHNEPVPGNFRRRGCFEL